MLHPVWLIMRLQSDDEQKLSFCLPPSTAQPRYFDWRLPPMVDTWEKLPFVFAQKKEQKEKKRKKRTGRKWVIIELGHNSHNSFQNRNYMTTFITPSKSELNLTHNSPKSELWVMSYVTHLSYVNITGIRCFTNTFFFRA